MSNHLDHFIRRLSMSNLPKVAPFGSAPRSTKLVRMARVLAAASALATVTAWAEPVVVENFDIFVDPPTAFVFVKLPQGWKFVGKLDDQAMRELPARVHTSLLSADADKDITRMAKLAEPQASTVSR